MTKKSSEYKIVEAFAKQLLDYLDDTAGNQLLPLSLLIRDIQNYIREIRESYEKTNP